ncbi:MAG TPA: 2OG-Fe(II) oxygenase [Allosphingosinicella sp.]|jgi:predicted 2-oxoglutarate/Fe(II)-dependent dioxygenase YbiX/peroxiredoxin
MTAASPQPPQPRQRPLLPGEPAPWFRAKAIGGSDNYVFDTVAGRFALLLFLGRASDPQSAEALACVRRHRRLFDDSAACFFGITSDPEDGPRGRVAQQIPGIRFFLDPDGAIAGLFGAAPAGEGGGERRHWLLVDPMLRAVAAFPIEAGEAAVAALGRACAHMPLPDWAPVLMAPNIFEPALCERLIAHHRETGGEASGFMREIDGKTTLVTDPQHKMRRDREITDENLCGVLRHRIQTRLVPMVKRSFQFEATRMERYIVGRYEAGAGHFRPHRDNTTKGTAHRRFAVTINLNAGGYEGGDLRFPEFGRRSYRAPTGGAVVFSCSLLHEATPVTSGERYAFLPFLYDDSAARLRELNNPHLADGVGAYKAS